MRSAEETLIALGIVLPPTHAPAANYVPWTTVGDLLFLAGHGPRSEDGKWRLGKLGETVSCEEGYQHARLTGVNLLATLRGALGSLDRVVQVVKVTGFVNSTPDFTMHPQVINGCSDLFVDVFGAAGRHARSAVGTVSLPQGISVEIEAIVRTR